MIDLRIQPRGQDTGQYKSEPALSEIPIGETITGLNGTDTVWKRTRTGFVKVKEPIVTPEADEG